MKINLVWTRRWS